MGSTQSIFYPDNGHRRDRAQQLGDDCKYAQQQYDAGKARLEAELGPYKDKLDKVLQAFGCTNVDDLDRLILESATGDALAHWKDVREGYDRSQIVDQVIMGAEGVVTIAGLAISTVGALAGGIGFFAGLAVTADILLVLGVIGAIFDIVNGAIQRGKLRDAINSLFDSRIKAKYVQEQLDQLITCIPTIQAIYQAYEEAGYDKDKILQKFKDKHWVDSLKTQTANITYNSVGQELADMDSRRGSWTNEDPDWHPIANNLDAALAAKRAAAENAAAHPMKMVAAVPSRLVQAKALRAGNPSDLAVQAAHLATGPPPPHDGHIMMRFVQDVQPKLPSPLHVKLEDFEDDECARVGIYANDDKAKLIANMSTKTVDLVSASDRGNPWTMRFVDPTVARKFSTAGKDFDVNNRPEAVEIYVQVGNLYLTAEGTLSEERQPSTALLVSYA